MLDREVKEEEKKKRARGKEKEWRWRGNWLKLLTGDDKQKDKGREGP